MKLLHDTQSFAKIVARASMPSEHGFHIFYANEPQMHGWIDILQTIYDEELLSSEPDLSGLDRCLQNADPIPFEEFLLPFVRFARKKLSTLLCSIDISISESVHAQMERYLLQGLLSNAGQCLELEYSLFRFKHDPFQMFLYEKDKNTLYQRFISYYTSEGFLPFFVEYSMLARLLVLQIQQWVRFCEDLFTAWQADQKEIEGTFFHGESCGQLTSVEPGFSDVHHNGQTVCILTLSIGQKLVYKPKNLDIDGAFSSLLSWIEAHGFATPFKVPLIVSRATHGWMEFIEYLPCTTQQEVQEYYRRAGSLLCLVYVLNGTDCHAENIIVHGSDPVLIDLETLFHQFAPWLYAKDLPDRLAARQQDHLQHSVLNTCFLPTWISKDQYVVNIGGLGGGVQEYSINVPIYKYINTDAMVFENGRVLVSLAHNVVRLDAKIREPSSSLEYIQQGFKQMYLFLSEQKQAICQQAGPLSTFLGCASRFVLRDTNLYASLLRKLHHPDYLRDATKRWKELDVLKSAKFVLDNQDTTFKQNVAEAEYSTLQDLDIPLFSVKVGTNDLEVNGVLVSKDFFPHSVFKEVKDRIQNLDDQNLQRQMSFISSSLSASFNDQPEIESGAHALLDREIEPMPWKPEVLLAAAQTLAEHIKLHAVLAHQGTPGWLGFRTHGEYVEFANIGLSLYDGIGGICVFLATLDQMMQGTSGYRDLISAALHPLLGDLDQKEDQRLAAYWDTMTIGGAMGIGSIAYALCRIGQALNAPELLDYAHRAALLITERRVQADKTLDVLWGSAGAILGLLKVYEITSDKEILRRATLCGNHLVSQMVENYPGGRSWNQPTKNYGLSGFSHGIAGNVYALLRLYAVTGHEAFYQAAEEGLGYERYVYDPTIKNWPQSHVGARRVENSWCHGAAGIGLARLGGLSVLNTPMVQEEIAIALETTQTSGLQLLDTLCCGNFGRLELFLTASEILQQPALSDLVAQQTSMLVQRAEHHGGMFQLRPYFPRSILSPELFQGAAGIGFQLLRIAYPDKIPAILLWK